LAVGNGGFSGGINWLDMVSAQPCMWISLRPAEALFLSGRRNRLWLCRHVNRYRP
jgi:hypothetical protein